MLLPSLLLYNCNGLAQKSKPTLMLLNQIRNGKAYLLKKNIM